MNVVIPCMTSEYSKLLWSGYYNQLGIYQPFRLSLLEPRQSNLSNPETFRTLSNIYDKIFCKNRQRLKAVKVLLTLQLGISKMLKKPFIWQKLLFFSSFWPIDQLSNLELFNIHKNAWA